MVRKYSAYFVILLFIFVISTCSNKNETEQLENSKAVCSIEKLEIIQIDNSASEYRNEESIHEDLTKNKDKITSIYSKYLKVDTNLEGKIIFKTTIEASGEVSNCQLNGSTIVDKIFNVKVFEAVKEFRFSPIPEGIVIIVNTFVFSKKVNKVI